MNNDVSPQGTLVLCSGEGERWAWHSYFYAMANCTRAFDTLAEQGGPIQPRPFDPLFSRLKDMGCERY